MDLMTLAAKITLDDSSYTRGISNAEKMGQSLAGKMSAMTVAVGNLAADVIRKSVSAINGVVSGAVDGYANYQQLVGGVETLFKTSANKVAKYAEQSYKTTGLSANQYMETVTSFSASLLQGLGGDTEQAAEMANMAITDMADNANKMGTDISSIQVAYQGFAKQNYTMLDNLKLGYGGTAGEMVRLINDSKILDHEIENLDGITFDQLVQAIHVVQTEMGITGTTAKEAADTISGSKNSLSAAWQDLLTAVSGTSQSDVDAYHNPLKDALDNWSSSFQTYMDNYIPALQDTVLNVGALVLGITDAVANLPTDLMSNLLSAGLESATDVVTGVGDIVNWVIDSITQSVNDMAADPSQVEALGYAIGDFIGTALGNIIDDLPKFITNVLTIGGYLATSILDGLRDGLFGEGNEVDAITKELSDDLSNIELDYTKIDGTIAYLRELYNEFGQDVTLKPEWQQAQAELQKYMEASGQIFENYGSDIQGALDTLDKMAESMRRTAIVSGMQKAMHDLNELYGEQLGRQTVAETAAQIAEGQLESAKGILIESLRAYAAEWADMNARNEFVTADERAAAEQMALHGRVYNPGTGEYESLTNLPIETLLSNLMYYGQDLDLAGRDVWNRSSMDKVEDMDTIMKFAGQITKYEQTIEDNNKAAEEAAKEAAATLEQITITQIALDNAMADQSKSFETAASGIDAGGAGVEEALAGAAAKIASIRIPSTIAFDSEYMYQKEDTGIDYVPYSGFRASLHRGEAVLTASENAERRNGGGTAEVVGAIQSLRNDIQNLRLVVGRKTFGRAVVDYGGDGMSDYIGGSESRDAAGYGT